MDTDAPCTPTLIRLPGYPLFITAIYALFGDENAGAMRLAQAAINTGTCVLAALLAWLWMPDAGRKRRAATWAFVLAALCPFTAIYAAVLMTETLTMFLCTALVLTATLAFKAAPGKKAARWWVAVCWRAQFKWCGRTGACSRPPSVSHWWASVCLVPAP